ncbi:DUF6036 family nucleotidyltransferase [Arthrobacter sp. M4]|uniref:DUF6036 family nucleotidyltransferase n=1 Tax=Arthrobacter sp. M4 TaxID=218160 RepID=UPI001CDC1823|nr:DUF6036 family nucleotidyltransferase [Arthrobacter sp. M4]MCA4134203.1 hypothetical protein [Arthrobacter sp. M4]
MQRGELEHAIRAATEIIRQESVFVIGSQSILGSFTENELPAEATFSEEVDIAPINDDDAQSLATELDAAIGEMSYFHETHGFYVQGVGRSTAVLPAGWTERLVILSNENTLGRTGLCLEPHDLCVAKLIAGRTKDHLFVGALLRHGIVRPEIIAERLLTVSEDEVRRDRAISWIRSTLQP